ncbi:DUF192 domain-containing protein [Marinobacter sp. F4206]|uniref:DUF192 domain-containing protein n=1 Tax=Marinobacter sp. F4206 TaxID=2861777 RepID=UPI001C5F40E5|nr:DUF192 domain-containing protein [Marinobacter sp. F4206]MBW4933220.1 DUF192 domain-containing protein [Marinobacter sp. F4206]
MKRHIGTSLLALLLVSLVSACSADPSVPQPRLPLSEACFITQDGTVPVMLEVADDFSQRQKGLMGRKSLGDREGMLFVYDRPRSPHHGFWMYKTLIALDIAYLGPAGEIGSIRKMAPCSSKNAGNCPSYPAGIAFTSAVEMNRDFFSTHGIAVGDRLAVGAANCPSD